MKTHFNFPEKVKVEIVYHADGTATVSMTGKFKEKKVNGRGIQVNAKGATDLASVIEMDPIADTTIQSPPQLVIEMEAPDVVYAEFIPDSPNPADDKK